MIMVTLSDGTTQVRVPQADSYPGYEGWTVVVSEDWPTLAMLKDAARAAVKELRRTKENATCATPSGIVQIDGDSKTKINGLVSMALVAKGASQPFTESFILADNSVAQLDADAAIAMGVAVGQYVSSLYGRSIALFAQIDAAADASALDAIDITAGWP
jgi:hypothetical protein